MAKSFTQGHALIVGVGGAQDWPYTVDDAKGIAGILTDPGRVSTYAEKKAKGLYAFNISIDLSQMTKLTRDENILALATTYQVPGGTGTVGGDYLRELRNTLNDYVDIFINDYLSVNSK